MRRLTQMDRDDRGVATLLVIAMVPLLLIAAAAAIDVNRFSQENSSAQHSADATALAVATDCALGIPLSAPSYTKYRQLDKGQKVSDSTPISCGTGEVKIQIEKNIDPGMVFGRRSREFVKKQATVAWGALTEANTLPLVVSDCEFRAPAVNEIITIYLDDPKPQGPCDSLPGGFSQLSKSGCSVPLSAGGTVFGVGGEGGLQEKVACITNPPPAPALPRVVFIPIYDSNACKEAGCLDKGPTNPKGPYLIKGFAALEVTGYSFIGNIYGGSLGQNCPPGRGGNPECIRGRFIDFVTSVGTTGSGNPIPNFGLTVVQLIR